MLSKMAPEVSVVRSRGVDIVSVATGLIGAITSDVYGRAKRWALKHYEEKRKGARVAGKNEQLVKGERFTIYGPDNNVLKMTRRAGTARRPGLG